MQNDADTHDTTLSGTGSVSPPPAKTVCVWSENASSVHDPPLASILGT
jgi:hypothetical protein